MSIILVCGALVFTRIAIQLVLVTPRFEYDPTSPHKGYMVVTVPKEDDDPVEFSVPIEPTSDILAEWPMCVACLATLFPPCVLIYLLKTKNSGMYNVRSL